jgi:hypothetical protein
MKVGSVGTVDEGEEIMKDQNLLRVNLQFFNNEYFQQGEDNVIRGGYRPDEEITFPTSELDNPLLQNDETDQTQDGQTPDGEGDGASDSPNGEGAPSSDQPQTFNFGGRIVDPNNPDTIAGAHQDFVEAQRYIQQLQQQNQLLQMQLLQMQQMQQQFAQNPQLSAQQQEQQAQEPEFKLFDEDDDTLMEKFYENPKAILENVARKAAEFAREQTLREIQGKIDPIVREREYTNAINEVRQKYADFDQLIPIMTQIIDQRGSEFVDQNGIETVYWMAKGIAASQMPSVEEIVNQPDFLQKLASNEQLRNLILQQQMEQKAKQRPPQVITNQRGSTPNLASEHRPKSISEGSKLLRKYWGLE